MYIIHNRYNGAVVTYLMIYLRYVCKYIQTYILMQLCVYEDLLMYVVSWVDSYTHIVAWVCTFACTCKHTHTQSIYLCLCTTMTHHSQYTSMYTNMYYFVRIHKIHQINSPYTEWWGYAVEWLFERYILMILQINSLLVNFILKIHMYVRIYNY